MDILTEEIYVPTKGNGEISDITYLVKDLITSQGFVEGSALIFAVGSTAGITTIEYEPGLKADYPQFFESIVPSHHKYMHDQTWHDGNGHSHVRAAIQGPSLQVPFKDRQLLLGTWQQFILIDFDIHPRNRTIIIQLTGTKK
ncbi:MAG: secondary thiamine-phosphate synthase enzyme YjbQ [Ignavibacteria bacterium]|nr:secondary thiamine-phosphate synthase enzyme YjbQ [Ignavibacteria bacterium]